MMRVIGHLMESTLDVTLRLDAHSVNDSIVPADYQYRLTIWRYHMLDPVRPQVLVS